MSYHVCSLIKIVLHSHSKFLEPDVDHRHHRLWPTSGSALQFEPLAHRSIRAIREKKRDTGRLRRWRRAHHGAATCRSRSRVFLHSLDGVDGECHESDGPTMPPASYIACLPCPSVSSFFQRSKQPKKTVSSRLFSFLLFPQPGLPTRFHRSRVAKRIPCLVRAMAEEQSNPQHQQAVSVTPPSTPRLDSLLNFVR